MKAPLTRRNLLRGAAGTAALAAAGRSRALPAEAAGDAALGPYPDDAFSRPAEDVRGAFETLAGVHLAPDPRTRSAVYSESALEPAPGGGCRWRWRSRRPAIASLVIGEKIRQLPSAISLRVRNAGAVPVGLFLLLDELTWEPVRESTAIGWRLGPTQRLGPGEDRVLRFEMSGAAPADGARTVRAPRCPFFGQRLAVEGVPAETACDLVLRAFTVHYAPAQSLRCAALEVPGAATAGGAVSLRARAEGDLAGRACDLEVRRAERVLWRVRLTETERAALTTGGCAVRATVPWYLPAGDYVAGLVAGGYRVAGAEGRLRVSNERRPGLARALRRRHRGRPACFLDGRPFAWQGYASYDYQPGNVAEFGASGATVFCVPVSAGRHVHNVAEPTWVAPDVFDFGEVDERVAFSLQANPRAALCLRVSLALPAFWTAAHPGDLARVATDSGAVAWEETGTPAVSIASAAWRRDQERALRALIRHCKAQPWASRLAGFWLMCEVTEEWFAWGCNDGMLADYGEVARADYARWVAGHPQAAGLGAAVPPASARLRHGHDVYPDDDDGRAAASYHEYLNERTAETIGWFARVVKDETAGRSLVGAFYGYVVQLAGEPRQALSGHFGLRRILDDPNVDLLAGIPLLDYRDLGSGYNPYVSATESILAADKLYCNENDLFSWLHPILWHTLYDPANPREGAISMHRRECANDAVHGAMAQKFSLAASWHHDAGLQADFARQAAALTRALDLDRAPVEEIAFLVDDASFAWTPPESTVLAAANKAMLRALGRSGAPVGVWLLSDAARLPRRIRLVVVPWAPAARPEALGKLHELLERGGRTVVVCGPVGMVDRRVGRWDPQGPARLLGLPIRLGAEPGERTTLLDAAGATVATLPPLRPRAFVEGTGFPRYADGEAAGAERPLAAGGRLLWFGAPVASTPLLRRWVESAGVHCYAPAECFVHAARGLAAVTAPAAGTVTLRWPEAVEATDLFDGWRGEGVEMPCPFALGQTRLFALRRRG
ncbi:MAG: hypothetical protein IT208_10805 [Chthonomonadales bacterium]|nr:hypothetical protein [Chthonomonadales bacterium]